MKTNRMLAVSIALLAAIFVFFEISDADLRVQDLFYNFTTNSWAVDAKDPVPRALFYTWPKVLIWTAGVALLGLALMPQDCRIRRMFPAWKRNEIMVVIGTLALAPTSVATLKATTNVFTPSEIRRYGGPVPYVKVCEAYPANDHPARRGRGFPAGHASGGFALMALAALASTRRARIFCIAGGLAIGSMLGAYQMLKGAHYLSHTIITALICWIIFLALRKFLIREDNPAA
ncbi:MAG: phosphatase PAP2 family protein [Verrucomicrobia bacterium]|nr:phosphatase PAP2 family protein [Verrucomicrobiota bacterium]